MGAARAAVPRLRRGPSGGVRLRVLLRHRLPHRRCCARCPRPTGEDMTTTPSAPARRRRADRRKNDPVAGRGMVIAGGSMLAIVVIAWLAAPLIARWGATEIDPTSYLQPPGG